MANIYIVDDDLSVINVLKVIIDKFNCGHVCGYSLNGSDALEDLGCIDADIAIVDLLMPEIDGITLVKKVREKKTGVNFIMLSQVVSKDMVARAYSEGVEFFIHKPVNSTEVVKVLKNVAKLVEMDRALKQIRSLFPENGEDGEGYIHDSAAYEKLASDILKKIGIGGDVGSKEICQVVAYIMDNGLDENQLRVNELCAKFSSSPKTMEQRMRRTVYSAMVNVAHMGIEDYHSDIFDDYASVLFKFEQVRKEMDYIRGRSKERGKASLKGFLYSLASLCRK